MPIRWRIRLSSPPGEVYALLATPAGRARFWAESAEERGGEIHFRFPDGTELAAEILESIPGRRYALRYFGGSRVTLHLEAAGGGTILTLEEPEPPATEAPANRAGWVSVLLNLKAVADHGVDLRNHDPALSWDRGFVDN